MPISKILFCILLPTFVFASDYIKGHLEQRGDNFYIIDQNKQTLIIQTEPSVEKSLASLANPTYMQQSDGTRYVFEFKGTLEEEQFYLEQVPTQVAGLNVLRGVLSAGQTNDEYIIDNQKAKFGVTKVLNGYEFDEKSKTSFLGKEVLAEGHYNSEGIFIINALTPKNLLTASKADPLPSDIQLLWQEKGNWDFIYSVMNTNEISQSKVPFRLSLYEEENYEVKPNDEFLVVTLSGRQGDSFGSVNGHFVAGLGTVKDNMELRGEVSNAYVYNGKDILSGNTSLTNYFSHIIQGQNNYRPTYTLIIYGIESDKLKGFRDALEESHIKFRTEKLSITPEYNCTTETVKALEDVGIKGNYKKWDNKLKSIVTFPLRVFGSTGKTLHYSLGNDASKFQPRPAFNSFAGVVLRDDLRRKYNIKRVDYIFYPQIPSERPVGGMAVGTLRNSIKYKNLYDQFEVDEDTKLPPEQLRPILEKELQKIE